MFNRGFSVLFEKLQRPRKGRQKELLFATTGVFGVDVPSEGPESKGAKSLLTGYS